MKSNLQWLRLKPFLLLFFIVIQGCDPEEKKEIPDLPDCFDNIQNQGELGVDCGGPCGSCPSQMTAKTDGAAWQAEGLINSVVNDSSIIILSGNGYSTMSLIYTGDFTTGTFNLDAASYGITASGTNYVSNTGTITFLAWSLSEMQVFGTFSFDAFETSGSGDTVRVTNGNFRFVPF